MRRSFNQSWTPAIPAKDFQGLPEVWKRRNWELGAPEVAPDLKVDGHGSFGPRQYHTTDYGVEGFRVTDELLEFARPCACRHWDDSRRSCSGKVLRCKGRKNSPFISLATCLRQCLGQERTASGNKGAARFKCLRADTSYQLAPARMAEWKQIVRSHGRRST